jgi:hypothetical protein
MMGAKLGVGDGNSTVGLGLMSSVTLALAKGKLNARVTKLAMMAIILFLILACSSLEANEGSGARLPSATP